jgi:hypothetical protein
MASSAAHERPVHPSSNHSQFSSYSAFSQIKERFVRVLSPSTPCYIPECAATVKRALGGPDQAAGAATGPTLAKASIHNPRLCSDHRIRIDLARDLDHHTIRGCVFQRPSGCQCDIEVLARFGSAGFRGSRMIVTSNLRWSAHAPSTERPMSCGRCTATRLFPNGSAAT